MELKLLRHATLLLTYDGHRILVDPMLNPAGAVDPVANTPNQQRNPLVDLPLDNEELAGLIDTLDAVLVTHTHGDHWDARARELLPSDLPLFCQPEDEAKIRDAGFTAVYPVNEAMDWEGIIAIRTGGEHGRGEMIALMAPVSGFVLQAEAEPTLYIAGDTVWCDVVAGAIATHQPDVVVVNAGAAQFNTGGPITMTADDVVQVAQARPGSIVIAVHLEAINHCIQLRDELRETVETAGLGDQVVIPGDGENLSLNRSA